MSSLSNNTGLVSSTIRHKQQVFYLVTDESLNSIKEKSLVSDILMLITSLLFGAFFSVFITIEASTKIEESTLNSLNIYKWIFLGFGIIFLIMTVITLFNGQRIIKDIKSSEADFSTTVT